MVQLYILLSEDQLLLPEVCLSFLLRDRQPLHLGLKPRDRRIAVLNDTALSCRFLLTGREALSQLLVRCMDSFVLLDHALPRILELEIPPADCLILVLHRCKLACELAEFTLQAWCIGESLTACGPPRLPRVSCYHRIDGLAAWHVVSPDCKRHTHPH